MVTPYWFLNFVLILSLQFLLTHQRNNRLVLAADKKKPEAVCKPGDRKSFYYVASQFS